MEDNGIIAMLFDRSEQAIDELSIKYERTVRKVCSNILDSREDVEECINDTWLGIWNAIPPAKPDPLGAYVCRVARNLALKKYSYNQASKRNGGKVLCLDELAECLPDSNQVEDAYVAGELAKEINAWLGTLDQENRMIFVRYYWYMDQAKTLGSALCLSEGAVKLRLSRMRRSLKKYLDKRGYRYE